MIRYTAFSNQSLTYRPLRSCSDNHNVTLACFLVRPRSDTGAAVFAMSCIGEIVDLTVSKVQFYVD